MTRPHLIDRSHRYEGPLPDPRAIPDDREPSRFHVALGIIALIMVAAALVGAIT
jgi:hypothetical protein